MGQGTGAAGAAEEEEEEDAVAKLLASSFGVAIRVEVVEHL